MGRNQRGLYHADYLATVDQEILDWLLKLTMRTRP